MVVIILSSLPLKCKLVKALEEIKGEGGLGAGEGCWKPACPKKLLKALKFVALIFAIKEVDSDEVDTGCVKQSEICRTSRRKRASGSSMAQLVSKAQLPKLYFVEKCAVPFLKTVNNCQVIIYQI